MEKTDKGGVDPIFDISFTKEAGKYDFWTAGKKHFTYWPFGEKKKKGIFGQTGTATSFACVTADDQGLAYSGGANSLIYVWNGSTLK